MQSITPKWNPPPHEKQWRVVYVPAYRFGNYMLEWRRSRIGISLFADYTNKPTHDVVSWLNERYQGQWGYNVVDEAERNDGERCRLYLPSEDAVFLFVLTWF